MVEQVEKLHPKLCAKAFRDPPELAHRKVHILIVWRTKQIPARVADGSVRPRRENTAILHVPAEIRQPGEGQLLKLRIAGIRRLRRPHTRSRHGGGTARQITETRNDVRTRGESGARARAFGRRTKCGRDIRIWYIRCPIR